MIVRSTLELMQPWVTVDLHTIVLTARAQHGPLLRRTVTYITNHVSYIFEVYLVLSLKAIVFTFGLVPSIVCYRESGFTRFIESLMLCTLETLNVLCVWIPPNKSFNINKSKSDRLNLPWQKPSFAAIKTVKKVYWPQQRQWTCQTGLRVENKKSQYGNIQWHRSC